MSRDSRTDATAKSAWHASTPAYSAGYGEVQGRWGEQTRMAGGWQAEIDSTSVWAVRWSHPAATLPSPTQGGPLPAIGADPGQHDGG